MLKKITCEYMMLPLLKDSVISYQYNSKFFFLKDTLRNKYFT